MRTPVRGHAVSSFGTANAFLHSPPMVESSARSQTDRAIFLYAGHALRRTMPSLDPGPRAPAPEADPALTAHRRK